MHISVMKQLNACDHPLLVKEYNSDPVGKDSVEMAKRLPKEMMINLFNSLETTAAICFVCNLDFQLPDRFKLEFSAEDEAKIEKPVMIHRAILGSVER
ncbi:hypothetical protein RYX36_010105, partial [Vicia faba]